MHLGIEQQSGMVYEGVHGPDLPVFPAPSVTLATLIREPEDWAGLPVDLESTHTSWVFREDSFDAVSRVRRGRLYQPWGNSRPSEYRVAPNSYDLAAMRRAGSDGRIQLPVYRYQGCISLLELAFGGQGQTLALGTSRASSAWLIVQTEMLANRAVMVTLKAKSAFGILPEIDYSRVDGEFQVRVRDAMTYVLDAAFKASPPSVVDRCRDAMVAVMAPWLVQRGHDRAILVPDLGKVGVVFDDKAYQLHCVSRLADVVRRLHVRTKPNERLTLGLRELTEEDAELAIQSLGFVIRELGWAKT
jgi:hypothetical protein